jgi:iron complex outermembrane receptor protein
MISRSVLLAGAAGAALFAYPAFAAETAAATGTADAANVAATDIGSDAEQPTSIGTGQADAGEEIIVTARRRQETAQQVPLAISVIGGEHIDSTGAFNVGRLQQLTPTLQYTSSNPRNTTLSIRGIGTPFGLTNDGFDQGVGIYVDDVYYSRAASSTFDFLDVQQVEVLRGPQGTLYGKNTTAGAVNVTTRQPTFDFEFRGEATVGNLGFTQVKAAVSGPLSDNLAARIATSYTARRGTIFNVASNQFINEQDNVGVRGQLLWKPASNVEVTLAGDYSTQNPECCGTSFVRVVSTQRPINRQFNALAAAANYTPVSRNPYDRLTDIDASLNAGNKIGGASLRVKWDTGPGTLTSVTAYRFWDWKPENDRDFTGVPVTIKSQNPSQQSQWTQEFRYNYSEDRIDFVLGVFGYKQKVRTQGTEQLGAGASRWLINPGSVVDAPVGSATCGAGANNVIACSPATLNGLTAYNDIRLDNSSAALFGQLSWKITDRLTVQPGIRVNYDKKTGLYERRVFTNFGAGPEVTFATPTTPTVTAQRDALTPQRFEPTFSAWNFSYDFNVNYKITPDILAYATYAKSFKTGGINLNGVPNDPAGNPILAVGAIKPERIDHYEIGLKSQFFDRKVTFNLSAFLTDIADYQALVNSGATSTTRGYLANADKVRTQGIEVEFSARPSDRFNLYFSGAYTDAKYVRFPGAPCPPELSGGSAVTGNQQPGPAGQPGALSPVSCDVSGQRLPGVSKYAASYGAEYNLPATVFGKEGEFYVGVDGNFRTDFSSNASPSDATKIDGYVLTNFRAGFRTDFGIDLYGWVRNAFATEYLELLQIAPGSTGLIAGTAGDPRTYGATLKWNF